MSLSRPSTFVFPNSLGSQKDNSPPPKKKIPRNPPPLTTLPTFSKSVSVFPARQAVAETMPKPQIPKKKKKKSNGLSIRNDKSFTTQEKALRDKLARSEAKSGVLRLPKDVVLQMSDGEFRIYLDRRLSALFEAVSTVERRRTKEACREALTIQSGEKFWTSTLLMREIDRVFFKWVLSVCDPILVWTPPFSHGKQWRAYIEAQVVSKQFVFSTKVQHDLKRFWIISRDRRDLLDQKKMRIARAAAKGYATALHAIKTPCMNDFTTLDEFTPEICWSKFAARLVISTGLQKAITAWMAEVAMQVNAQGSKALELILEAAVQKTGRDMRHDFALLYKQAKQTRELAEEQQSYATQGETQFDWSFL